MLDHGKRPPTMVQLHGPWCAPALTLKSLAPIPNREVPDDAQSGGAFMLGHLVGISKSIHQAINQWFLFPICVEKIRVDPYYTPAQSCNKVEHCGGEDKSNSNSPSKN